jgi:hypothetical protein
MGLQRNVTLLLGGWILVVAELDTDAELADAATTQATHQWSGVTRSSSLLLDRASIVEARWLGGACVELDGAAVAGSVRKAHRHGLRNLCPVVPH